MSSYTLRGEGQWRHLVGICSDSRSDLKGKEPGRDTRYDVRMYG